MHAEKWCCFSSLIKKIINGVRQYFHCHLPLESEPTKSGNVWMGEKFPIEAFLKLLSAVLLWCSALNNSLPLKAPVPRRELRVLCKQIFPQVLSKLFFWISTDPKANTAWKNRQCKGKGKILIHILCPKHYRANLQSFYSTELYHIKKQN